MGIGAETRARQNKLQRHVNLYRYELGWAAIPTQLGQKRPAGQWKRYQKDLPTTDETEDWKKRVWGPKAAGVGIVTGPVSGVTVLDVDNEHADNWLRDNVDLPPTAIATSQHGDHYYFETLGLRIRNATRVRGITGLDVRGEGGFIMAPPSRFADGSGQYKWRVDPRTRLATMPQPLIDIFKSRYKGPASGRRTLSEYRVATYVGSRNVTLMAFGGTLLARALVQPDLLSDQMHAWNNLYAIPPLPEAEVDATVKSVLDRHNRGGTRRAAFDPSAAAILLKLNESGMPISELSRLVGRARSTVHRAIQAARQAPELVLPW